MRHRHLILALMLSLAIGLPRFAAAQLPGSSTALEFKGKVVAAKEAEIAARVDGWLVSIDFTPGQIVNKGDLLFEFDPQIRAISLTAAQARRKVMEAQLQLLDVKLRNTATLRARNVTSEMEYLEAKAQRDISAANVEEAKANVDAAQLHLDEMKLFAPINGMMSRPFVREGAYLTLPSLEQNRLALITQLDPIDVVAEIPFEAYMKHRDIYEARTQAGRALRLTLILPNGEKYSHSGRLIAGVSEFKPATQVMAITVEFDNPEFTLRPGLGITLQSSTR
jgi:RND family efflux transporter MFP subunit